MLAEAGPNPTFLQSTCKRVSVTTSTDTPLLVVYKEIVKADIRKLQADSNDSKTGGGARDLRLPAKTFGPIMRRIFTMDASGRGGREIKVADVLYLDADGNPQTTRLEYWPATSARPAEDRIAKVHASPALGIPATSQGRVFVLFIKYASGLIRVTYAYEAELKNGVWAEEVKNAIFACMKSADSKNSTRNSGFVSVQGYYEFTNGKHYCHAE